MTFTHIGRIAAVFAVVCWSAGNVIVARLDLSGIEIAFWRQYLGAVVYVKFLILICKFLFGFKYKIVEMIFGLGKKQFGEILNLFKTFNL